MNCLQENSVVLGSKANHSLIEKMKGKEIDYILNRDSFPLVISGTLGSGRKEMTANLAIHNIRHKAPFVYLDGTGSSDTYWRLYEAAAHLDSSDNFYVINIVNSQTEVDSGEKLSHTFDPINPLVGNSPAFVTLFGPRIGPMIHHLALCEHENGNLVTIDHLTNYCSLTWLQEALGNDYYGSAHYKIREYKDLTLDTRIHFFNCQEVFNFRSSFEGLACVSTNPDISFDEIYKQSKYLLVMLPALELDPDALNIYATVMMLLLEQSRMHQPVDNLPTEFLYNVMAHHADVAFLLESNAPANTVHSIESFDQLASIPYHAHSVLAEKMKSALVMNYSPSFEQDTLDAFSRFENFHKGFLIKAKKRLATWNAIPFGAILRVVDSMVMGHAKHSEIIRGRTESIAPVSEARLSRVRLIGEDI